LLFYYITLTIDSLLGIETRLTRPLNFYHIGMWFCIGLPNFI